MTLKTIHNGVFLISGVQSATGESLRLCVRFLLCVLMLLALASCGQSGQDDPDDPGFETGIPTEVRFSLSTRSVNTQTRANDPGKPKDPNRSQEFIHDWWIALVDAKGNVSIFTRSQVQIISTSGTSGSTDTGGGFEMETFKAIIPSGVYNLYAFANINPISAEDFKNLLTDKKLTGKSLSSLVDNGFSGNSSAVNDNMQWKSSDNIPMTGFIEGVRIQNTIEEIFSIEVIRTVAKIEFDFENPSVDDISLQELQFGPITSSDISLLPQYSALNEKKAYTVFGTPSYGTLSFSFTDVTLPNGSGVYNMYFYCKESLAPSEGDNKDSFNITLKVRKGDAEPETKTFYTRNILSYINRNDWIHIPIVFNDWTIIWHLHYYPPIGGYPPIFEQGDYGQTLTTLLTTGGEFEIVPEILKGSEPHTLTATEWESVRVENPTGTDLFVAGKEPKKIDNPGNTGSHPAATDYIISGELDPMKVGTAHVKIWFYLDDTKYSGTKMECNLTIIRQNERPSGND